MKSIQLRYYICVNVFLFYFKISRLHFLRLWKYRSDASRLILIVQHTLLQDTVIFLNTNTDNGIGYYLAYRIMEEKLFLSVIYSVRQCFLNIRYLYIR